MRCRWLLLPCLVLGPGAFPAAADPTPDPAQLEFFEKKVRPLLAEHCWQCHGPDKQKGKLRLDSRAELLSGGESGPAIVVGEPEKSRLVKAVGYTDTALQMPPKGKLSDEQVATLSAWVKMGAPWPDAAGARPAATSTFKVTTKDREFWSFRPVREPAVPELRNPKHEIRNEIDAFVTAKRVEKGLTPVPPADKRTLIRRAYFDLVGLPPTPEE